MNRISEYDLALVEDLQSLKLDGQQGVIIENAIARISQPNASNGVSEGWKANAKAIWAKACVGREGYCSPDLQDAALTAIGDAFAVAEQTARAVDLPPNYLWSDGNREKFHFGRDTAADAIRALAKPLTDQKAGS